jgi:hypothetical protein
MGRCSFQLSTAKEMKSHKYSIGIVFLLAACTPHVQEPVNPSSINPIPEVTASQPNVSGRNRWMFTPELSPHRYVSTTRTSLELQGVDGSPRDSISSTLSFTISQIRAVDSIAFSGILGSEISTTGNVIGMAPPSTVQDVSFSGHLEGPQLTLDSVSGQRVQLPAAVCDTSAVVILPVVEEVIPRLPAPLLTETTWTDSVSIPTCQGSIPTTLTRIHTYRVKGELSIDRRTVLVVDRTDKMTVTGEGAQEQHRVKLRADGTGSARLQLDPLTGAVIRSDSHQSSIVAITASGRTRNFVQSVQRSVVKAD